MTGEYKFLRTKNGFTSFAKAVVVSKPSATWQVFWNPRLPHYYQKEYDLPFRQAIKFIEDEHMKRNGTSHAIEINSFEDILVDTKDDAVMCAATMVIWKSLGYLESEIEFVFSDERWQPTFTFARQE